MEKLSRREFNQQTVRSMLLASLGITLFRRDALAGPLRHELVKWVNNLNTTAADLKNHRISPREGQLLYEGYLQNVGIDELLKFIDFSKLIADIEYPSKGEIEVLVALPEIEGMPETFFFKSQIIAMQGGRAIPPHGHNNQLTAFLTLDGELRGRHFDRQDEGEDFILTPTVDRSFTRGSYSTISDQKDNVHWFTAVSEKTFMYNIVISDLHTRPNEGVGRQHLDLRGGDMGDGRIRGKRIHRQESYEIYG